RHGITVTLSRPPDGGTTAEVYLPAAVITLDAEPPGWHGRAGETPVARASEEAGAGVADLPFSARRFASGPEPPRGPEADAPEPVPVMLGAPVPSPDPGTSAGMTEPEPVSADLGDGPPIFESVRSGYHYAFGRAPLRSSEQQAGQSPGQPARPPASWGNGSGGAVAGIPTAGPASPGPPQRIPQPRPVRRAAADPETPHAPAAQ